MYVICVTSNCSNPNFHWNQLKLTGSNWTSLGRKVNCWKLKSYWRLMSTGASASVTSHCWFLRISCSVRPLPAKNKCENMIEVGWILLTLLTVNKHMKLFKNMHMVCGDMEIWSDKVSSEKRSLIYWNSLSNIMLDKGTFKTLIINHNFSRHFLVVLYVRQWHLLLWPFNYNILPTRWVCNRSAKMVTPVGGKYYNVEEHIIMQSHPQCTTSTILFWDTHQADETKRDHASYFLMVVLLIPRYGT